MILRNILRNFLQHIRKIKQLDWTILYWRIRYGNIPVLIHIPKTGGTYLQQGGTDKKPVIKPMINLGHSCAINKSISNPEAFPPKIGYKDKKKYDQRWLKNYFVFSTVRNIFDWLVSYWGHSGGHNPKYRNTNHYDYEIAQRGFEYLIKAIADREDKWPSRKFIHFAIFSYHGDLIVDWLNRTETLDEDLKAMAEYKYLSYSKKEKQRVGIRDRDYRSYYNEELIELVYKTWGRELKLFGYTFEDLNIEKAVLKRKIPDSQKRNIKYFWANDKLIIKEKEVKRNN
jgi:hypothetical protein